MDINIKFPLRDDNYFISACSENSLSTNITRKGTNPDSFFTQLKEEKSTICAIFLVDLKILKSLVTF